MYRGQIEGHDILLCRQIDDFAIGCKDPRGAELLIAKINSKVTTDSLGHGKVDEHGVSMLYNGLDIHQTADYIKLSAVTYISRFLATHGWDTDSKTIPHDIAPLPPSTVDNLQKVLGPEEGTKDCLLYTSRSPRDRG